MIAIARRSFTEESGLKNSHFTYIVHVRRREAVDLDDRRAADRAENAVVDHDARALTGSREARRVRACLRRRQLHAVTTSTRDQ